MKNKPAKEHMHSTENLILRLKGLIDGTLHDYQRSFFFLPHLAALLMNRAVNVLVDLTGS